MCETGCLTLREEPKLGMSEKRGLRRIFGLNQDELTGGWKKFYSSKNIIRITKLKRMS
jgi:hypothetical protein